MPSGYVNQVPAYLARVEMAHICLCQVAGNTVQSHMAGDAL